MNGPSVLGVAELAAGGRDLSAPFLLRATVRTASGSQRAGELECLEVLRHQPGRRLTLKVRLEQTEHAAKLFLGGRARRYLAREVAGLRAAQSAQLPVPRVVAELGLDGGCGLLAEWIPDGSPVLENDTAALDQVLSHLGRLHRSGLLRTDPHLGNYLQRADGSVLVLDGDGIRAARWPARVAQANLARSLAELPPACDQRLAAAWGAYSAARWGGDRPMPVDLARQVARARGRRVERFLAKTLRDCREFHFERTARGLVACVRPFWSAPMQSFAANPEGALTGAQVVKAGNSATVFRTVLGERCVIVKRYNVKNPWHGLRRLVRPVPRYRQAWRNGHRLSFLRIPTPSPLALVERRAGWFTVAYLVMDDGGDVNLEDATAGGVIPRDRLAQAVALLRQLRDVGLVHGDAKASNFVLDEQRLLLVDLDALQPGATWRRDVQRFLDNWAHEPGLRDEAARALQGVGMGL